MTHYMSRPFPYLHFYSLDFPDALIFGIVFVLGRISAAVAAVPPPDGSSPAVIPVSSASVPVPPDSQGKRRSSSEDEGLDVPLQSLVATPYRTPLADAATNLTPAGGVVASSRVAVVTFAEDVTFGASSSHVGETVPPPEEKNAMPALAAAGDGNTSESGFIVEDSVEACASTWLPDISSIFGVVDEKSSQKRGLALCDSSFS